MKGFSFSHDDRWSTRGRAKKTSISHKNWVAFGDQPSRVRNICMCVSGNQQWPKSKTIPLSALLFPGLVLVGCWLIHSQISTASCISVGLPLDANVSGHDNIHTHSQASNWVEEGRKMHWTSSCQVRVSVCVCFLGDVKKWDGWIYPIYLPGWKKDNHAAKKLFPSFFFPSVSRQCLWWTSIFSVLPSSSFGSAKKLRYCL